MTLSNTCIYLRAAPSHLCYSSNISICTCVETMAIPVSGSVSVEGNRVVIVLALAGGQGEPPSQPVPALQTFVNKILEGHVPVHESRLHVLKKHVAAMISNVQRGLRLTPVGLFGAWSDAAEQHVLRLLQRPKLIRSKQTAPLSLPPPSTGHLL